MSSKYKVGDLVSFRGESATVCYVIGAQNESEYFLGSKDGAPIGWVLEHELSPLIAASSKYKPGDRVHKSGIKGTVRTSMIGDNDVWRYLIDFDNEWIMSEYIMEHELSALDQPIKPYSQPCQCGAVFTSFKEHHMFYCPLYRKN